MSCRPLVCGTSVGALVAIGALATTARADVGALGDYATDVAIEVPSFRNLAPSVRLAYSSTGGNGIAGVGWRLEAGDTIARTSATGGVPSPLFAADDRFVIGGDTLVPCTTTGPSPSCVTALSAFGSVDGFYSTRRESFMRLEHHGGITPWTVWLRDGSKGIYSTLDGGETWQFARSEDRHGNAIDYHYTCATGLECELTSITYGGHATTAGAAVRFYYETRPDIRSRAKPGGGGVARTHRLRSIEVSVTGDLVRAYALTYTVSATSGNSLLRTVQEFPRDATVLPDGQVQAGPTQPRPPLTLATASTSSAGTGWSFGSLGDPSLFALDDLPGPVMTPRHHTDTFIDVLAGTYYNPSADDWFTLPYSKLVGDFDGDGRTDLMAGYVRVRCRTIVFNGALTTKDGFKPSGSTSAVIKLPAAATDCIPAFWTADLDGDHRDDALVKFNDQLYSARLAGTNFELFPQTMPWTIKPDACTIADVDGDSRDDLVCLSDQTGPVQLVTARSRGDGTFDVSSTPVAAAIGDAMGVGDVDADGFTDVVINTKSASGTARTIVLARSNGNGTYTVSQQVTTWHSTAISLQVTDLDGDGLADILSTGPATTYVGLSVTGVGPRFDLRSNAFSGLFLLGDVDGDGRVDLVGSDLTARLGDGAGGFAAPITVFPTATCNDFNDDRYMVDMDGDGRTDLLCVYDEHGPYTDLIVNDYSSTVRLRDPHNWMSGDFNGDGRHDLVYVHAKPGGIGTVTVLAGPTPQRVPWSVLGPNDPSAANWMVADVGGPGGVADGKDDLVFVDTDGSTLVIRTMISLGNGTYLPDADYPWVDLTGTPGPYGPRDLLDFFPLDVDGDGDADLVHFVGRTQLNAQILLSQGNGKFIARDDNYFMGSAQEIAAASDFRPADINGDGLQDLVNIQSTPGVGTVMRSLISRGDGTFTPVTDPQLASWVDISRWQPMELNGDGQTDFIHIKADSVGAASWIELAQLLSRGDGTFQYVPYANASLFMPDPELANALEATRSLYPVDLNGDGLTDLLHVGRYRDSAGNRNTALIRIINPGPGGATWQVATPTKVPGMLLPTSVPWGWRGHAEPTHMSGASFAIIGVDGARTATFDIPSDRLNHIDNGNGGTTDIFYEALVGARDYLPSGSLPTVATAVVRQDFGYVPATTDVTTYGYDGAMWSNTERRLLGYSQVMRGDAKTFAVTWYSTAEECPMTEQLTASFDTNTGIALGYARNVWRAPGAEPYLCQVQQQSRYACNATSCRLEDSIDLTYDDWGNIERAVETITEGPVRHTETAVHPNDKDFILDLPSVRAVYQDHGSAGLELLSQDVYLYDGHTDYLEPPAATGELRTIRSWDSTAHDYVETELQYDPAGLLVRASQPFGAWVETTYDSMYQAFPVQACDAVGCTTSTWDVVIGKLLEQKDVNLQPTTYAYDAFGALLEVTNADGSFTRTRTLDLGAVTGPQSKRQRIRTETSDGSPGDGVLWAESFLDGWGRVYRVEREGGAAQTTDYDGLSQRVARTSEVFPASGAPSLFTTYAYDASGRMIYRMAPDGSHREWHYDVATVDSYDELGNRRSARFDGLGRTVSVSEYVNGNGYDSVYGYDAAHRLVGMSDAIGLTTSYYYDTLGRLIGQRDPDRGLREYTYRPDGQILTQVDAKGQRLEFEYDGKGRPALRKDLDVNGNVQRETAWTYDELPGVGPMGASLGRVVRVDESQPGTTLQSTFAYDVVGRPSSENRCIDGTCYLLERTFDPAGRLAKLTYPGGERLEHVYDATGNLVRVGDYVPLIKYSLDGRPEHFEYGNKVTTTYAYDPARRWTDAVTITGPSSPIYQAGYAHDLTGRITNLSEQAPTNADQMAFTYDELGRLLDVWSTDPSLARDFKYDEIGRLTYTSTFGDYFYDDPDHPHAMTSTSNGSTRTYDPSGNLVYLEDPSGRGLKLEWTVDDRPSLIDGTPGGYQFAYDADGNRVKKTSSSENGEYFSEYFAVENGQLVKYYFAGDRLVARNDGSVAYYHQDHSHSTRVETDANGDVANKYQYDVTGVSVIASESFADDIGFGGVHGEEALGLTYMNARYYDAAAVQFISADSGVRDPFAPQSMGRYAFVEGDPVNNWDPSGHRKRNIEIMQEGTEFHSHLDDAWFGTDTICQSVASFCGSAVTENKVTWNDDGSVKHIELVGMSAQDVAWQWGQNPGDLNYGGGKNSDSFGTDKSVETAETKLSVAAVMFSCGGKTDGGTVENAGQGAKNAPPVPPKPFDVPEGTEKSVILKGTGDFSDVEVTLTVKNDKGTISVKTTIKTGDNVTIEHATVSGRIIDIQLKRVVGGRTIEHQNTNGGVVDHQTESANKGTDGDNIGLDSPVLKAGTQRGQEFGLVKKHGGQSTFGTSNSETLTFSLFQNGSLQLTVAPPPPPPPPRYEYRFIEKTNKRNKAIQLIKTKVRVR